jgi:PAS domain S-box-containing protein
VSTDRAARVDDVPSPITLSDIRDDPQRGEREHVMAGRLLWLGIAITLVFAAVFAWTHSTGQAAYALSAVAVTLASTLMFAVSLPLRRVVGVPTVYGICVVGSTLADVLVAGLSGRGVDSPILTFAPLLLFAAATRLSFAGTLLVGLLQAGLVGVLAAVQLTGAASQWLGPPPALAEWTPAAAMQVGSIAVALVMGLLLRLAINSDKAASQQREKRISSLFALAADAFWEMDAQLRFTAVSTQTRQDRPATSHPWVGRCAWETEELRFDAQVLDAMRADMESRQPFENVLVAWQRPPSSLRWLKVSGRPQFDARGVFIGYWGVSKDTSQEVIAEQARAASEARHRELFNRSPSPLVVHRETYVIDVNVAALNLFGLQSPAQLLGRSLLDFYDADDGSRQRAQQRVEQVQHMALGQSLPSQAFTLRAVTGRRLVVQVSTVRVQTEAGPAELSIIVDETERRRAESARARTEALLAHVVTISPDLMVLADMQTGRCVLVNDAFVALAGDSREALVGRTIVEMGVWPSEQAWQLLVREAREHGRLAERQISLYAKDGRQVSVVLSGLRFVMEGRDYLVCNGRDVTAAERERLEHAAVLENADIGIAMTRQRRFVTTNPRFEQMFGWQHGELLGQHGEVVSSSAEDYADLITLISGQLDRGEAVEFERMMRRKDGSTFLCRFLARAVDRHLPQQGATIWIAEDVTEKRAVEKALARARDEAEAANRAKSAFLANTSHEIRTPLNGMVGLARLARQAGLDEHRRARYLEQIDESAKALAGVISDILDLSKIEAGRLTLESLPFDLHALLESIEHGYQALAEARALSLRMTVAPDVPRRVLGDPVRVRQVLTNFLNNALKFTDRGGVRLGVKAVRGDRLRFEVQDTGPGISESVKARLFKPFSQADVSTTRRYGGTGLGLSICRELAQLMQGEVGVESAVGRGSLFWAELPLPATGEATLQSAFGDLDAQGSPLTGMQVLVVEDNPVNMMIAVALLEQWGVQVTQAANGVEAVEQVEAIDARGNLFDLILMDMQMPVRGGHETTRILRERYDARTLPIVALTAAALTSEREAALEAGMNDFLTKPIDAQRLHDALLRWRDPTTLSGLFDSGFDSGYRNSEV